MAVLPACMHHTHACLQRPEVGVRCPETGVTDGFELSVGCWELNLGSLEEQQMLFIAEPFLCPCAGLYADSWRWGH